MDHFGKDLIYLFGADGETSLTVDITQSKYQNDKKRSDPSLWSLTISVKSSTGGGHGDSILQKLHGDATYLFGKLYRPV